jgi:hypothetical protein
MAVAQFTPLPVLRRLIRRHGVDPRYRKRARARLFAAMLAEPLRGYERIRFGRPLSRSRIHPEPVFLLGYGRSGTTHLHNLLSKDPQFGVISNYQATMQPFALTGRGWLENRLSSRVPARRPMDNVAITLDAPQEEEIALVNSSEHAALHFMSFPRSLPGLYDAYVLDLGRDPARLEGFRRAYLDVLQKASLSAGGRRLLLKTPTHMARIPFLLETFPAAKFVHIVRNPYLVYQSMRNMYRKVLPGEVLQELDWDAIDAWTLDAYEKVVGRYLADRKRIPEGRLLEIRYEELEQRPLEILNQIYRALDLGGLDRALPEFERYLGELGSYEKNRFDFPHHVVDAVNRHWGFALEAFGYERIEPGQTPL